jgi:hypothetical protein
VTGTTVASHGGMTKKKLVLRVETLRPLLEKAMSTAIRLSPVVAAVAAASCETLGCFQN